MYPPGHRARSSTGPVQHRHIADSSGLGSTSWCLPAIGNITRLDPEHSPRVLTEQGSTGELRSRDNCYMFTNSCVCVYYACACMCSCVCGYAYVSVYIMLVYTKCMCIYLCVWVCICECVYVCVGTRWSLYMSLCI